MAARPSTRLNVRILILSSLSWHLVLQRPRRLARPALAVLHRRALLLALHLIGARAEIADEVDRAADRGADDEEADDAALRADPTREIDGVVADAPRDVGGGATGGCSG